MSALQTKTQIVLKQWSQESTTKTSAKRPKRANEPISWFPLDVITAALILYNESENAITISERFCTEEDELRRVFLLLYDVFRYQTVLSMALNEVGFFENFLMMEGQLSQIWLLFYDLYRRKFLPREKEDQKICFEAFESLNLNNIEQNLWEMRIKLAAALARHRIRKAALHLNHLLPFHLRDERLLSVQKAPFTAWVNTFVVSKNDIIYQLKKLGLCEKSDIIIDHVYPKILNVSPDFREILAKSEITQNGSIVLQDRSFLLSSATMSAVLAEISLNGAVAQTHLVSPRVSAYLATLLAENKNIDKLVCFGCANRTEEYQNYLSTLRIPNCEFRAEKFIQVTYESNILENVVAIIASPPSSWTGVSAPVDLICSRNGDLTMLKDLTKGESEPNKGIIDEQKHTLKFAMSFPQVQVVLYEVHSILKEEREELVENVMKKMNEWAKFKHEEEQRLILEKEEAEERARLALLPGGTAAQREQREKEVFEAFSAPKPPVEIPNCDLFEWKELPILCAHGTNCYQEDGCFLALIQRKEITNLDAKYMIRMAEARGLFGDNPSFKKPTSAKVQQKEVIVQRTESSRSQTPPKRIKIEMDRIAAPTHSALLRWTSSFEYSLCQRFQTHIKALSDRKQNFRHQLMQQWWRETYKMIKSLLPQVQMSPRTRAKCPQPMPLKLPRVPVRKLWPLKISNMQLDARSEPNIQELQDFSKGSTNTRRNSF